LQERWQCKESVTLVAEVQTPEVEMGLLMLFVCGVCQNTKYVPVLSLCCKLCCNEVSEQARNQEKQ